MFGWSFSVGRVFGVEVRLHVFFVFLLVFAMMWAAALDRAMLRGVMMWMLVLLALAVREAARGLAAAWFGIDVRSVLLLPTGGIQTYGSPEALARAGEGRAQKWMALTGPAANLLFGLTLAGLVLTVSPGLNLWQPIWVDPRYLVRTAVWVNLLLAAVNLLPAWPLDAGRVVRGQIVRGPGDAASVLGGLRTFTRMGPAIALGLVFVGILSANFWLIMAGIAILVGAQVERQGLLLQTDADIVTVGDVMLTEYSILSASATLEDAIEHARHTLQDVFPVVRGGNMVGAVARQNIIEALESTGNGYVQGIMTKAFQTASPGDSLIATLNRVTTVAGVSSQLVPVVDGERIVGIVTPQNLQRSMGLLTRKARRDAGRSAKTRPTDGGVEAVLDDSQTAVGAGGGWAGVGDGGGGVYRLRALLQAEVPYRHQEAAVACDHG